MNIRRKPGRFFMRAVVGAVLVSSLNISQAEWFFNNSQIQRVHASALGGTVLVTVINGSLCLLTGGLNPDRLQFVATGLQALKADNTLVTGTCRDAANEIFYITSP